MKLPHHNRYDYSPITERRDYDWPGGKRLAFVVTTNISWHAYGKGRGHDNAKHGSEGDRRSDVLSIRIDNRGHRGNGRVTANRIAAGNQDGHRL